MQSNHNSSASLHLRNAHTLHATALAGLLSLTAAASSFAAFEPLPPGAFGIAVTGTSTVGEPLGTVVAALDDPFNVSADLKGVLRSFVVNTGTGLDFYYQVLNTSTAPAPTSEIFRIATASQFNGLIVSVSYRTDLTNLDFGAFAGGPAGGSGPYTVGTVPQMSADRDFGSLGSIGFDFDFFQGDPGTLHAGETSRFAVVRTDATTFLNAPMAVSGTGTGFPASLAPVPEPGVIGLLAFGGLALARRRKARP